MGEMREHRKHRDGKRDLKFVGERIAFASSRDLNSTRWTELGLYRTKGNKFVLVTVGVTQWVNESNRYQADVLENEEQVIEKLMENNGGELSWVAKELLDAAGIDYSEEVE